MASQGAVHVTTQRRHYTGKDGRERVYETHLLRRSWREDGKVRNETVANLSKLPAETIELIRASLAGERFVPAGQQAQVARSLPHGHAAAVHAMARKLGLPALLGPPSRDRDLACALVVSRVLRPASKLSTAAWWDDVTLGVDLGVAGTSTDDIYAAMDWLVARQDSIEKQLARRHLHEGGIAMFDLSSSWVEGSRCELAAYGYSRDGKRGKAQIEYGLLTDKDGRPVAVRVFTGNTGDPKTFPEAVDAVRGTFGLQQMIMVGDRGMITSARIKALREVEGMAWITCLRGPAIKKLMADDGPLQLSLFDEQDLAEITSPDYPGERLIACRNPVLAAERARRRTGLLAATEDDLGKVAAQAATGRIKDPAAIGLRAGKVLNKRKMAKHFTLDISEGRITWQRDQASIDAEAATDGIYVIRTPVPEDTLDAPGTVTAYKSLSRLERAFRSIKADDLDLRPIWHRLEDRVKAHVLICMLACYLTWHLRQAWAPLTYTDEHPPHRASPVARARRSPSADAKAARKTGPGQQPIRGFRDLLDHLATLTRNDLRYGQVTIPALAEPTPTQRRAFGLIGAPIPLTLSMT
ncbi:MAG TPA: IS1634 family transposase [Streptosporangiaceae bacterium]|nr:IS1634 family transposase [Streptosporangiaceae bacterium]